MATANCDMKREVWKSPPSLNCPRVEVSNLGRVRTLAYERKFIRLGVMRTNKRIERVYSLGKDSRGRKILCGSTIRKSLYGKFFLVHRLVAECFVPNPRPEKYDMVFFKNGDVTNCKATNLVWGNKEDKNIMARGNCAIYKIHVLQNGTTIGEYAGCGEVGRALGCTKQAVHTAIMNGKPCKGYQLVATKGDGYKPYRSIEDVRRSQFCKA